MEELIKRLERVIQTGAPDKDGMHPISAEAVLEVVKAQLSTNSAEVGTDCISRQAAIDALERDIKFVEEEREKAITRPEKYHDRFVEASTQQIMGMAHALQAIEELPSIRQGRTCVNCGRTINNGGWYADGGTRCPIEEHYALPKDGYCHLWEKRNVTDDDYPERREE